jgi:CubicO group peptidase (beta-lactamase class C family)
VGLDPEAARGFTAKLADLGFVDAALVVKDGAIVAEEYRNGYGPNVAHQVSSVSKSIVSALVGIAIGEGAIRGVDQPIAELLPPELAPLTAGREPAITLRHLLGMSMGFATPDEADTYLAWRLAGDRARHTLTRRLKHPPGEVWAYNNGAAHLVSVALTKATGMSTREFAESRLFKRIGVRVPRWPQDGRGYYVGGTEMHMTARDLARFGMLYLDKGRHAGEEIVPEDWIAVSTRPTGLKVSEDWGDFGYGFFWWTKDIGGVQAYAGRGWGAQFLYVIPELRLVLVVLSDPPVLPGTAMKHWNAAGAAIEDFVSRVRAGKESETSE